jgi:hypothetical protein
MLPVSTTWQNARRVECAAGVLRLDSSGAALARQIIADGCVPTGETRPEV